MLYNPERHLPYKEFTWDEAKVIETIHDIIQTTLKQRDPNTGLWPIHPKDQFDGAPLHLTDFYMGAAGVVWALYYLSKYSNNYMINFPEMINQTLEVHLKLSGASPYEDKGSYFVGEAGVRFVKQLIGPTDENKNVLKTLIESKLDSTENELLYGLPGILALVNFLFEKTADQEYLTLQKLIVDKILSTREFDVESGALFWHQQFTDAKVKYLGAAHGSIGNYSILLKILKKQNDQTHQNDIIKNLEKLLSFYVHNENDRCNWPALMDKNPAAKILVHWCHGATGVVTELATEVDRKESSIIDELIIKAGKLIWDAGPLEKGTTLCHGTAGSGMAFLKIFERTNDELWLKRAQSFAMYSIDQRQKEILETGFGRFSLWTGDLGLALFLSDTLRGKAQMPGLDII